MKIENIIVTSFVVLVGFIFLLTWFYVSRPSLQIGGALQGVPGTDPIGPFMAVLIVLWFVFVGTVVHLRKPKA